MGLRRSMNGSKAINLCSLQLLRILPLNSGGGEISREEEASYKYAIGNSSFTSLNLNAAPLKGLS